MIRSKTNSLKHRNQQMVSAGIFLVGAGLFLLALVFIFASRSGNPRGGVASSGEYLADFTLTDLNGQEVSLSDYRGQTVLINLWALWCPPCLQELPDIQAYYQAHQEQGFTVLAINSGDPATQVADYVAEQGFTFPVLLDPNASVAASIGLQGYPTSVLVGADGEVKTKHVGLFTLSALEKEITPWLP